MYNYEVVVVLYNTSIEDSETLLTLRNAKGFISDDNHVIVWDNSPISLLENQGSLIENIYYPCKVSYYWDGINSSLSYIYNIIRKRANSRYTIILDHDTSIPIDLFVCLDKIIGDGNNNDINLFLPMLCSHGHVVSPAYEYKYCHKRFKETACGRIDCNHLMAMNSGMVINSNYFRDIFTGYNEKLKFYGTDNDFMRKYRKQNKYAYILPMRINHRSNFREDPLPQRIKRFVAIKEAAIILAREDGILMALFERFRYFLISVKYDLKDHTILFTKSLFI